MRDVGVAESKVDDKRDAVHRLISDAAGNPRYATLERGDADRR